MTLAGDATDYADDAIPQGPSEPAPILISHTAYNNLVKALEEAGIEFIVERPGDPIDLSGIIVQASKRCFRCRNTLTVDQFSRNRHRVLDCADACTTCNREIQTLVKLRKGILRATAKPEPS